MKVGFVGLVCGLEVASYAGLFVFGKAGRPHLFDHALYQACEERSVVRLVVLGVVDGVVVQAFLCLHVGPMVTYEMVSFKASPGLAFLGLRKIRVARNPHNVKVAFRVVLHLFLDVVPQIGVVASVLGIIIVVDDAL